VTCGLFNQLASSQLKASAVFKKTTTKQPPTQTPKSTTRMMKSKPFHRSSAACALLAAGALVASSLGALAGPADDKLAKSVIEPEPEPSRLHCLLQVEVGSHYITPRGLDVVDAGVTIQPLVLIFFDLYNSKTGFLNDITLIGGVWNDWGTKAYGAKPGQWNEIDPSVGLSFKFAQNFQFDATYTGFRSMTESYPTSTNLDLKLTYHDSFLGKAFSINPYVEFFDELSNKATVTFDPRTSTEGYYFALGIDPTYKADPIPLTVELPTYVNIVSSNFYQKFDGQNGGSGAAVFSTGVKFSVPLKFIPKQYGSWTAYAGYQYYYLNNVGLLDGNQALTGKDYRETSLHRFYGGINVFF